MKNIFLETFYFLNEEPAWEKAFNDKQKANKSVEDVRDFMNMAKAKAGIDLKTNKKVIPSMASHERYVKAKMESVLQNT